MDGIEENLESRLLSLNQDKDDFQEDFVARLLRHSRRVSLEHSQIEHFSSPFDGLDSCSENPPTSSSLELRLHIKDYDAPGKKRPFKPTTVRVTVIPSDQTALPKYKSTGRLDSTLLARNVTIGKYNPYTPDDEKLDQEAANKKYQEAEQRYLSFSSVTQSLQAQRSCLETTDIWKSWIEELLEELELPTDAIVQYYHQHNDDSYRTIQQASLPDSLLTKCLQEKHRKCQTCDMTPKFPFTSYTPNPPPSTNEWVMAGLLAKVFHRISGTSLWHMISFWNVSNKASSLRSTLPGNVPLGSMCSICCLHHCSLHGVYREEEQQQQSFSNDERLQVNMNDPELIRNIRYNISLPQKLATSTSSNSGPNKSREGIVNRQKGTRMDVTKNSRMDERDVFVPCSHEGSCIENTNCSCSAGKVACEYFCGCDMNCKRRFSGCSCASGRNRICFNDNRCECWANSRECDPWLCKECGVIEVLDQANKYKENIRKGRCSNNRLQLGLPAKTIKAPSEVQGYGLFAGQDLQAGDFIGEYKGEILTREESDRRGALYAVSGAEYLFNLNRSQELDATNFGNKTKFINNSLLETNINVLGLTLFCNGVQRILLYAKRAITAGDELLYNYDYPEEISNKFWERGQRSAKEKAVIVPGATKATAKNLAKRTKRKLSEVREAVSHAEAVEIQPSEEFGYNNSESSESESSVA